MTSLTIRNLDDPSKARPRIQAVVRGRSVGDTDGEGCGVEIINPWDDPG